MDAELTRGEGRGPLAVVTALWRPLVMLAVVAAVMVAATRWDWAEKWPEVEARIRGFGAAAPVVFIAVRAGLAVLAIPGSAVSALAGVLFSPVLGIACVSLGKTLGAALAFVIARYWARDSVEGWLSGRERWQRLDALVEQQGALVVALNRFFPLIPFNLQNYAFGLTSVPFGTYLLWTWLGMLPGAVLVVSGVGVIKRTLETGQVPWALVGVLAGSVIAMLILTGYSFLRLVASRRSGTPTT